MKVGDIVKITCERIPTTNIPVKSEYPLLHGKITEDSGYGAFRVNGCETGQGWWFHEGALVVSEQNLMKETEHASSQKHGHPRFYELLEELGDLHSRKNHDYATGGDPLGNFKRRRDLYSRYPGLDLSDPTVVALVDAMKQLDAALWFKSNGHEAAVEGFSDRMKDIAVYSIIAMVLEEEKGVKNG